MTGADKGFQTRLCKKRMWWTAAGELTDNSEYRVGFRYEKDDAKSERLPSLCGMAQHDYSAASWEAWA